MAQLRVRLRGKPVYNLTLDPSRSYLAGRKEDCDIVLQPEKGISREHFKLFYANESWNVEVVSRYGEVHYNGQNAQNFALEYGSQFSIAPYEFEYLNGTANEQIEINEPSATSTHLPALKNEYGLEAFDGNDEKTVIGAAPPTVAHIKIVDSENETKEIIRLDAGNAWLAGRDPSCHIQIKDQRVSRRQFEIRHTGSQYYIIDLGSVNGTLVNGNVISSVDATAIKSGDAISVLNNFLYFELHDANFQNRMELVKASTHQLNPLVQTAADALPMNYQQPMPYHIVNGVGMPTPMAASIPDSSTAKGKFDYKKNRPKIIAAAVLLLGIAYFFSDGGNEGKPANSAAVTAAPGSPMEMFLKLKPEQQALIKQRYKDAKNLYMQGKYQLAQDEIVKIQELVADYEDIKEIERLSKEAIFIQDQQRRQEELEKAKVEIEEKIQKQADECQKKINPSITMAEMEDCLSPVMQFDPEHARILNLKSRVEQLIADKEAKAAERAAYQDLVDKMRGIFNRAQQVHKNGKPLDAIAAYEKVLKAQLPDPHNLKSQARQNIESIRKAMGSKTAALQAEADKFYQAQNLKGAIMSLRQARIIDPTNTDLPEKIDRYTNELKKQMMVYYQEGILAEGFGEIEGGAKDKWKKILDLDVPDGEYYKKALIKLKKYGAL